MISIEQLFSSRMQNKKFILVAVVITIATAICLIAFISQQRKNYQVIVSTDTYNEYIVRNDSEVSLASALEILEGPANDADLERGIAIENPNLQPIDLTPSEGQRGIIGKWSFGNDIYELRSPSGETIADAYSMYRNDELLFTAKMEYGSEGPILDARIVAGVPSFTYLVECTDTCTTDVFYVSSISKEYSVADPRYLFAYEGKIGFIAADKNGDRVFFDGSFITPAFESIHTHNCCATHKMLPTIYDNGVLIFTAQRGDDSYLAEVLLR
jgi:hypothetical protein